MENGQVKVYTASVNEFGINPVLVSNATAEEKAVLQGNDGATHNRLDVEGSKGEGNIKILEAPKPASLSDTETRRWYLDAEAKITDLIDGTKPLEQQAKQAFELRNQFRTQARAAMSNRTAAQSLEITDSNRTWEQIVEKYTAKGFTGDALYQEIIKASTRSRTSINKSLGIFPK
jgi:hypothetical protein